MHAPTGQLRSQVSGEGGPAPVELSALAPTGAAGRRQTRLPSPPVGATCVQSHVHQILATLPRGPAAPARSAAQPARPACAAHTLGTALWAGGCWLPGTGRLLARGRAALPTWELAGAAAAQLPSGAALHAHEKQPPEPDARLHQPAALSPPRPAARPTACASPVAQRCAQSALAPLGLGGCWHLISAGRSHWGGSKAARSQAERPPTSSAGSRLPPLSCSLDALPPGPQPRPCSAAGCAPKAPRCSLAACP